MLEPEPCFEIDCQKRRLVRKFNHYLECIKEDLRGKWKIEEEIPLFDECNESIKYLKELGEDTSSFEKSLSVLINQIKNEFI